MNDLVTGQESEYSAFHRKLRDDHGWDSVTVLEKWLVVLKSVSVNQHQAVAWDAGIEFWSGFDLVPENMGHWIVNDSTKDTTLTFEVLDFISYGVGIEVIVSLIHKMEADPGIETTTWLRMLKSWFVIRMTCDEQKIAHFAIATVEGIFIIKRLKALMAASNELTIEQAMKTIDALPCRNGPSDSGRRS